MIEKRKEIRVVEVATHHICDNCKAKLDEYSIIVDTTHTDGYDSYGYDNNEFCSIGCMRSYPYLGLSYDIDDSVKLTIRTTVGNFKKEYNIFDGDKKE
jgi:hypothetical protein